MIDSAALAAYGVLAIAALALLGWMVSVLREDVSVADSLWPVFIALAAWVYAVRSWPPGTRLCLSLGLVTAWAARLAMYIHARNRGQGEDRRYAQMRARHGSAFQWRSAYLVFGLQGVLAWIVSAPFLALAGNHAALGPVDMAGAVLAAFGIAFEAIADSQMARFKRNPAQQGQVMDQGLWRFSRHPNYFGEACTWWGLGVLSASQGELWVLVSPLLMTVLLLRVSGVSLLEKDIADRRPGYRDYVRRTNAFVPGPRKGRAP